MVPPQVLQYPLRYPLVIITRSQRLLDHVTKGDDYVAHLLHEDGSIGPGPVMAVEDDAWFEGGQPADGLYVGLQVEGRRAHRYGKARDFVGDEPFVVALGDSIITGGDGAPLVRRLMEAYDDTDGGCAIAFQEVPEEATQWYGVAAPAGDGDVFQVEDLIEKPAPGTAPSNLAIAARYILPPEVFDAIDRTPRGKNDEFQLTDAIRLLMKDGHRVVGVKLAGGERRCDIGNFASYYRTFVDFALADKDLGPAFAEYLKRRLSGR